MIYIKPTGGLCNRMRTIDSLFSLCKIYKIDLTVLWTQDKFLNCPFNEVFETPKFKEFNLKIIDCPAGFPENFPRFPTGNYKINSFHGILLRQLKNFFSFRALSSELRNTRNILEKLTSGQLLKGEELATIYSSSDFVNSKTTSEMDIIFIDKVENEIKIFLEQAFKMDLSIVLWSRLVPMMMRTENTNYHNRPLKGKMRKGRSG